MQAPQPQDRPIASLAPLGAWLAGALAAGGALGAGLARLAGWPEGEGFGTSGSALLGVLAVSIGTVPGVIVLIPAYARSQRRLGLSVMVASSTRFLLALGAAVAIYFLTQNEPRSFFSAFLSAGILTLIAETAWSVNALRRSTASATPPPAPTDSRGAHAA